MCKISKAAALVALLAASPALAVDLTFWHYWDGANGQALQKLIDQYQKEHPGVNIKAEFVPGSDLQTKLQTAITGKRTPSMAIADLTAMPNLVRSGALAALDPYIAKSKLNLQDYYAGPMVYGRYNGKQYSLPVSASNLGLFYNKDLFRQAGLDPNKPPKTWEDLVSMGKTIQAKTGKQGYELFTQGGEGTTWQWQVFLWGAGGSFLNKTNTAAAFNGPAGVKALQFWTDLVNKDKVSSVAPWGLFGRGEAAMVMDGSWMTQFFPEQVDFELGAAPFPYPKGMQPATNMGGEQVFVFNGDPATQQAAWDFVNWFSSTPVQVQWDRATGFMPVKKSVASAASYKNWVKNTRPLLQPFVNSMTFANPRPPVPQYAQISDRVATAVQEALTGRAGPQDALNRAAQDVDAILK